MFWIFFNRLLLCLVFLAVGWVCVRYPRIPLELVGRLPFAEKYFTGGSYDMFIIIGILLMLLGFAVLTGVHEDIIKFIVNIIVPI